MSEQIELPDGALDGPWAHRGEDVVRQWERQLVRPWTDDFSQALAYFCWRTGMSESDAKQWLVAIQIGNLAAAFRALTQAYEQHANAINRSTDSQRERWEEGAKAREQQDALVKMCMEWMEMAQAEIREWGESEDWRRE